LAPCREATLLVPSRRNRLAARFHPAYFIVAQFRIYQALYLALFSGALYRDVARRWKGVAAVYVLLLVAVAWLPTSVRLQGAVLDFAEHYAPHVVEQMPVVHIDQGRVRVEAEMPYVIRMRGNEVRLAVFDTTGATTTLEQAQAPVLLTATELIVREDGDIQHYPLEHLDGVRLDRESLAEWVAVSRYLAVPFMSLVMVLVLSVYRVGEAFVFGALGWLLGRVRPPGLPYPSLVRIAAVAITPSVWCEVIAAMFGYAVPVPILLALTFAYLYFGVRANRPQQDAEFAA